MHRLSPEGYTRHCQHWIPAKGNGWLREMGGTGTYFSLLYNIHSYFSNTNE